MPVPASPTTPVAITEDMLRMFLRDYALGHLSGNQGNLLIDDVQFKPDELVFSVRMAVSAYNALTPITSYLPTGEDFPNEYVLLIGCARFLMMSESFHQLRNQASVQDGDIAPTGIYEKYQAYLQLAQTLQNEWYELSRKMKNQMNMESAYGHVGSGYRYVGRRID